MTASAHYEAAEAIWKYMHVHEKVENADVLVVLGSIDDRVASYAATLSEAYKFKHIVISGGVAHKNDLLATKWGETTEAEHFTAVMKREGCRVQLLLEDRARNTGENAQLTHQILVDKGIDCRSIVVVTKPYMERRAKATFDTQWPDRTTRIRVTSPDIPFDQYCNNEQPYNKIVAIMVGDLDRIMQYPTLGYQSQQEVPDEVKTAFTALIQAGYTQHLLQ